jgi:hypothetical protein
LFADSGSLAPACFVIGVVAELGAELVGGAAASGLGGMSIESERLKDEDVSLSDWCCALSTAGVAVTGVVGLDSV